MLDSLDADVRADAAVLLVKLGNGDGNVIGAIIKLLQDEDKDIRSSAAKSLGKLAQDRSEWTDEQILTDLADYDSLNRARTGIVLAYRHEQVGDNLLKPEIVEQIRQWRKDGRPWVRQASLYALFYIDKRKTELETEARQTTIDRLE